MSNAERRQALRDRIEDNRAAARRIADEKNAAFARGNRRAAFAAGDLHLEVMGNIHCLFQQLFELHRKEGVGDC